MLISSFLQNRLVSIINSFVRAIVEEAHEVGGICEVRFTSALERRSKETVEQISQLFCRLTTAQSSLQRQKLRRKWLLVQRQPRRKRSSVKPSSTGLQVKSPASERTNEERGLRQKDVSSRIETLSGDGDLLCSSSEDETMNISEEGTVLETVEAVFGQDNSVIKVQLDHKEQQMNCSSQCLQQKELMVDGRGQSAVKIISKEDHQLQETSSDTLEIIQSLEVNVSTKGNDGRQSQETIVREGTTSGGNCNAMLSRKLKCEACDKTFTYRNNLKRHQKTFHSGETPHACLNCGEHFGSKWDLRAHLRKHKVEKSHACTICEKVFRLPSHLKKHLTSHTNERPFACTTCGKTFALISTLKAHERTHSGEKTFICMQCGMTFLTKSYLHYHQRVHTGEKPYTCTECGKTFAQKSNLRVHKRLHTGEKPFRCEDCGESFLHANSYKSHKQLHTGVKAFICEHCGKGFRRGTHLKTHLLTHSGLKLFKCDLCSKTFAVKGSLKAHRLIHTGEKSFACDLCDKSFTQASSLGKHRRTHTGERPYRCELCSKSFGQSSHLHQHHRTSHPATKALAASKKSFCLMYCI